MQDKIEPEGKTVEEFYTGDNNETDLEIHPIQQIDERWYDKVLPLIDQVNKVNQVICKWPGFVS